MDHNRVKVSGWMEGCKQIKQKVLSKCTVLHCPGSIPSFSRDGWSVGRPLSLSMKSDQPAHSLFKLYNLKSQDVIVISVWWTKSHLPEVRIYVVFRCGDLIMGHHVCVCVSIRVPQASVVLVERRWIPPVLFPFLCVISLPGAFCPSKGNWHAWMKCFALVFLFQGDLGLQGDKGDKVCMFYLWQRRAGQRKMKMRYLGTAEAASGDLICWEQSSCGKSWWTHTMLLCGETSSHRGEDKGFHLQRMISWCFGFGVRPDVYSCAVTHRGKLRWWEDPLVNGEPKESRSVTPEPVKLFSSWLIHV